MRKLFKERKLFKGGNYMRKYGMHILTNHLQDQSIKPIDTVFCHFAKYAKLVETFF